jgi:DNA polymerase V
MSERIHSYIAIDLKSFYASVECVERGLDPLTTNLVVADESRTEKTICLAVSPSLKAYGIPGRARLFEVVQRVKEVNGRRKNPGEPGLDYIVAKPRMALYMEYSTRIYHIYLNYVAPEDIHVYSVDEVFMDVTHYLGTYRMTARQLAEKMMADVLAQTGITATAGIGTNLYLCKVAMDIVAKHVEPDPNGARIAELDEMSYRRLLWDHQPLTDFWRVGRGYQKKLASVGLYTMGDIARCSLGEPGAYYNEELLYKLFGVNAELLIDHAWGYEPTTIALIKSYRPQNNSINSGQVLQCPYAFEKGRLVVREMTEQMTLDLVEKGLVTDQMVLTVGYDIENLTDPKIRKNYHGEITVDHYGRRVPKHAHGTVNLKTATSSTSRILEAVLGLYDEIVNPLLLVRRLTVVANHLKREQEVLEEPCYEQQELFTDYEALAQEREAERQKLERERRLQEAMLSVKKRYGKNAILKGTNLQEGATSMERNQQIGGHRA